MQARKKDSAENGYAKRRFFDLKTTVLIITAMFGTGGITGLTSYLTDPNIAVQAKVERVAVKTQVQDLAINSLEADVRQKSMRMEYYIKSHAGEEDLRKELIDQEFKHIKELLIEIKSDLKIIKNSN